jgi:hypothetical protein
MLTRSAFTLAAVAVLGLAGCRDETVTTPISPASLTPSLHGDPNDPNAHHSHWRFGHLTWVPVGGNTIEFAYKNAWRRSGYFGTGPGGRPAPGDIIFEGIGSTGLCFGDGQCTSTLEYMVTSIDEANDWLFAQALDPVTRTLNVRHTYAGPGTYTADSYSCCRVTTLVNAGGASGYGVTTTVHVGTGNRSPVSNLVPIINVPVGADFSWTIPAADADGDPLRFRMATLPEAGSLQGGGMTLPTGMNVDPMTGVVTWNAAGTANGQLRWTQQIIEELDANGAVKGQVGIDYIIRIVAAVEDNDAPLQSGPSCGSILASRVGDLFTLDVTASDAQPTDAVVIQFAGVPAGASVSTTDGNPASGTLTWTPSAGQDGPNVVTWTATDGHAAQAVCSYTILVEAQNRPPVADAGADQRLLASSAAGALVSFDGSGSNDPDGTIESYEWSEGVVSLGSGSTLSALLGKGSHRILLTVTDDKGATSTDEVTIIVLNNAPVANAGPDQQVQCAGARTIVDFDGAGSTDGDGSIVNYSWSLAGSEIANGRNGSTGLPRGSHNVVLAVTDDGGLTGDDGMLVEIVDTELPVLTLGANPSHLWSPNHKYVPINVTASAVDVCGGARIVGGWVESNEPDDDSGDGKTAGDISVTRAGGTVLLSSNATPRVAFNPADGDKLALRAERKGSGASRIYSITLEAVDDAGNRAVSTITVTVPHNQ